MGNGMIVCVSNCSHQLLRNAIGTKDGKHLSSVDGIKCFLEINKCLCSCQGIVVYFLNNPSQGNDLRDCQPTRAKTILVESQYRIQVGTNSVK